jgi:hypothetical protein
MSRWGLCAALALGAAVPALAQTQPVSPLLQQVLSQLAGAKRANAAQAHAGDEPVLTESGLFGRYAQQHKDLGTAASSAGAVVPALGWAMEQLDPTNFAVIRPIPVGGSGPLLRTGDVFVVQFSTSLPGQVRLENVDPAGRVIDLGLYTVLVDQLNRLPRDKGIQLQGQPGVERLRFYFYPCLPAEGLNKPWAAEFKGKLPPCSGAPTTVASHNRGYGNVTPRALVNLAQPNANVVFAASRDYQPGEVTLMEARIRHESRQEGRTHAP